jgi:ribose 1,5-bisphosphokinase
MTGRLIAVVGPSGVGKDSVIAALCAARPGLRAVRRVITRPPGLGGEAFEAVDRATFEARRAAGDFALAWGAHGLFYGIPAGVAADLARGGDLLANLSRAVLTEAAARFPGLVVLQLTARPDVLAARLGGRGRETGADIAARLARPGAPIPPGLPVVTVSNDGPIGRTVAAALAALYPENG